MGIEAKGASEDRLAHMLICWRRTPGSPETACLQRWMTGLAGERQPCGSTEVDLVVIVVVVVVDVVVVVVVVVVVLVVVVVFVTGMTGPDYPPRALHSRGERLYH